MNLSKGILVRHTSLIRLEVRSKVPSSVTISWIYFIITVFALTCFDPIGTSSDGILGRNLQKDSF
jgi:hypothetical protein